MWKRFKAWFIQPAPEWADPEREDERWIMTTSQRLACGDRPGICENAAHHMMAIRNEKILREAYRRGQRSR